MATDRVIVNTANVVHHRTSNAVCIVITSTDEDGKGGEETVYQRVSLERSEAEDLMNALIKVLK